MYTKNLYKTMLLGNLMFSAALAALLLELNLSNYSTVVVIVSFLLPLIGFISNKNKNSGKKSPYKESYRVKAELYARIKKYYPINLPHYTIKIVKSLKIEAEVGSGDTIEISEGLVDKHPESIVAVVAHELGHIVKNHTKFVKSNNTLMRVTVLTIYFASAQYLLNLFSLESHNYLYTILLGCSIVGYTVNSILFLKILRDFEFEADHFAKIIGLGEDLKSVLVGTSDKTVTPVVFRTHPSNAVRIKNLDV